MNGESFRLLPFAAGPAQAPFTLTGRIRREGRGLTIDYALHGPLDALVIPPPAAAAARRDGLWQATCFEAFLAAPGAEAYRELNLSPAGHWNGYRLDGYRHGLRPDPELPAPALRLERGPGELRLELRLHLPEDLGGEPSLEAGICAVIEHADGALSYWALAHPGPEPDFHRREGFRLRL